MTTASMIGIAALGSLSGPVDNSTAQAIYNRVYTSIQPHLRRAEQEIESVKADCETRVRRLEAEVAVWKQTAAQATNKQRAAELEARRLDGLVRQLQAMFGPVADENGTLVDEIGALTERRDELLDSAFTQLEQAQRQLIALSAANRDARESALTGGAARGVRARLAILETRASL